MSSSGHNSGAASKPSVDAPPGYDIPSWSGRPQHPFSLDVLKNGTVVENLPIGELPFYVVGRRPECDIVSLHASLSRIHAVFQHSVEGGVFLYDMGSTHGTLVNKKPVPRREFVPVYVGDVVRFGQSSRLFIIEGPAHLRRKQVDPVKAMVLEQKMKARQAKLQEQALKAAAEEEAAAMTGVSWGQAGQDSAVSSDDDDEEEDPVLDPSRPMNQRQRDLMDRLHRRKQKMSNIQKEMETLQRKEIEQGLLTKGQEQALQRTHQQLKQLGSQVESLEETIRDSFRDRKRTEESVNRKKTKKKGYLDSSNDDSDDFYDRTNKNSKKKKKKNKKTKGIKNRGRGGGGSGSVSPTTTTNTKAATDTPGAVILLGTGLEGKHTLEELTSMVAEGQRQVRVLQGSVVDLQAEDAARKDKLASATDSYDQYVLKLNETLIRQKLQQAQRQLQAKQERLSELETAVDRKHRMIRLEQIRTASQHTSVVEHTNAKTTTTTATTTNHVDKDENKNQKKDKMSYSEMSTIQALQRFKELQEEKAAEDERLRIQEEQEQKQKDREELESFMKNVRGDGSKHQLVGEQYKKDIDAAKLARAMDVTKMTLPDEIAPDTLSAIISSTHKAKQLGVKELYEKSLAQKRKEQALADMMEKSAGGLMLRKHAAAASQPHVGDEASNSVKRRKIKQGASSSYDGANNSSEVPHAFLQDGDHINKNETWVPPKNQKGDGRTSLNDKYGY